MKYNLKEIFKGITPDNIKDIPVIKDSMNIFIEILEERAKESINISSYTENKKIRNELFKTYLSDLYESLDSIKYNQKLINFIASINKIYSNTGDYEFISREVLEDMLNRVSDEHFMAFRNFREKKGTIEAIKYIFHLIATLINSPDGVNYIIIEGENPFELDIEGTLPPEFYYYIIAPLAHPAGFTYSYAQSIMWELVDYFFPIETIYTVRALDVNCVTIDPITQITTRRSTSFKDRKVIDIRRNTYVWPRSIRIYFGGEHEGEYLENLTYANGHSTVELKDSDDHTILTFGDYCTLYEVIESTIRQNDEFDVMISELIFSLRSNYNAIWDPVSGSLIPSDDTIVKDYISIGEEHAQPRTPYLSWDRAPFFSSIGYDPYKWDTWNGRGYPDSGIITRISQSTDKVYSSGLGLMNPNTPLIGDGHIWGKHEFTLGQSLNEFISDDIPQRVNSAEIGTTPGNDILYGKDSYLGKETILTQPGRPRLDQAYISGDAFHMTYVSKSTEISGFIVRDDLRAYIVPDVFELENSIYVGSDKVDDYSIIPFHTDSYTHLRSYGTDCDKTIRINSFIVRDDEYSFVLFNDATSENITRPESIQITPEWSLGGGLGKASGPYLIGDEINSRVPKWDIPRLRDSFFNIGIYNKIGITRYDIKLDNHYGSRDTLIGDRTNILGEYELIGGTEYSSLVPGFWNNGFHQLSDEFEFGVFRGDKWLPDNNVNKPVILDIDEDYELSYEYTHWIGTIGNLDSSDNGFIIGTITGDTIEVFNEHSDYLGDSYVEFNIDEDYELSYDPLTQQEVISFNQDSDYFISELTYEPINEDYELSYEYTHWIGTIGNLDSSNNGYIIGTRTGDTIEVFNEHSDYLGDLYVEFNNDEDYELSYEYTHWIGTIGNLDSSDNGFIIGTITGDTIEVFNEHSDYLGDLYVEFNIDEDYELSYDPLTQQEVISFNQDSDYFISELTYEPINEDYELSYEYTHWIGTIGNLDSSNNGYIIGTRTGDTIEVFNEHSDYFISELTYEPINDNYELSYEHMYLIGRISNLDSSDNGFIIGTEINDTIEVFDEYSDDIFHIKYK